MATNFLSLRSSAAASLTAVNLTLSTLTGSTISGSTITALSNANMKSISYSTLQGSSITTSTITTSTITISSLLQISSSGLLGIGTNPTQALHVQGSTIVSGAIGVGTSVPAASLDVNGSIISRGQLPAISFLGDIDGAKWTAKLGGYNLSFGSDSGSFTGFESSVIYGRTYQYGIQMNSTGGMYVKGSVGIGITNPSQKLEVSGTVRATGYNLSGYNLLTPKMIYVGSQMLNGVFSGTTNASGVASFPVIIGAYGESIIEGPFSNGVNPDTNQYFKAYYVTCQITNGNDCQIGVAINNTILARGVTYSAPSFMVILQSGFFLKWTQFPTQAAYSYTNAGLNLQVYQSNTSITNFQVNYITVHCVYLHTSYTDYTKIAGLTYNSSYQQFS